MFELVPVANDITVKGFHSIYYFEFGKDFYHKPEVHDFWEMVYVDNGTVVAVSDNTQTTLTQGQVIFHAPGEYHAHISNKKVANNMLIISFDCDGEQINQLSRQIFNLNHTEKNLLALFKSEADIALNGIPNNFTMDKHLDFMDAPFGSSQLLGAYLNELIIRLIRNLNFSDKYDKTARDSVEFSQNQFTELICDYMKDNIFTNLSLADICNQFLIGKSKLSIIFKDYTGMTPMEYYNSLKINKAKQLIRENNLSVSEIADKLGYSSIHIFSRAFKHSVGFSPMAYKKSIV